MERKITCSICGMPIGQCDIERHNQVLRKHDPRYTFDPSKTIQTPHINATIAPVKGYPYVNEKGQIVVDINPLIPVPSRKYNR
jgi:hypothetical protein